MNSESLFYLYIAGEYEYIGASYTNQDKQLSLKVGDTLFNLLNNRTDILSIMNDYLERFLDLNTKILDIHSCISLLNNFVLDLDKKHINSFLSQLIFNDIKKICSQNITYLNTLQKDLIKEKLKLSQYTNLIDKNSEISLNTFITQNQNNFNDKTEYKKILYSDDINKKVYMIKKEIKLSKKEIEKIEEELEPITLLAKLNLPIHRYVNSIKNRFEVFTLFFSKKYAIQKKEIKDVFKKVLSSEIEIPSCIINYATIEQNTLKKINTTKIKLSNLAYFNTCKPYIAYSIGSLDDLFNVYTKYFIDNNTSIHICKNCGKYFIPFGKQVYCNNVFHNNKSCRELSGDMKKNNDSIYVLYRSNYKTQFNKMNRNKKNIINIKEKFNKWNQQAKSKTQECKDNVISFDELKMWFKNNQNWHK